MGGWRSGATDGGWRCRLEIGMKMKAGDRTGDGAKDGGWKLELEMKGVKRKG